MKLGRLNHIGVATPSIADSVAYYREVMGAVEITEPFDLPEQGVKVCFVGTPGAQLVDEALDGTQIELIEPAERRISDRRVSRQEPARRAAPSLLRGCRYRRGSRVVRGAGQAHPRPHPHRGAWDADLFPPPQGHDGAAYRDHGDS